MLHPTNSRFCALTCALLAFGCSTADKGQPAPAPMDSPGSAAAGAPAPDPTDGMVDTGQVAGAPADGDATPAGPAPGEGPRDGAAEVPTAVDTTAKVAVDEFGCALDDKRVSRTTPCHDDPDPCGLNSGYPGDQYCLLPPPEGEGIQIHIGPEDYGDLAAVEEWLLQPGEEFNNSVLGHIPLEQDVFYSRMVVSMRPGSHHWIGYTLEGKGREGVYEGSTDCAGAGNQIGSLSGGQNLIYDNPPRGIPAPENEGLGRSLPSNSSACINLHAYNFTEEPQLRELWFNLYFIDEADVTQRAQSIGIVGGLGMSIPPGTSREITYTETFGADGRILQLFGHRHAWTPRFAVWLNQDLIYDSWDWVESRTFNYDSLTQNPPIDSEAKMDGAVSGMLEFKAGDQLKFSCYVENESDVTLRFSNELYGGEMCNMWGSAVGAGLSAFRF